jgi:hypothetical protein
MWSAQIEAAHRGARRYRLLRDAAALSCAEVLDLWRQDAVFRDYFIGLLADAPFAAYRWETPAATRSSGAHAFEFVLLDSPELEMPVDRQAFAGLFAAAGEEPVIGFPSLGGDAFLIAPCPRAPAQVYGHLAAFLREGPQAQRHALWRAVGAAVQERLAERPLWLSTAGGGVAWLHVRLDSRPKYYRFLPYAAGRAAGEGEGGQRA